MNGRNRSIDVIMPNGQSTSAAFHSVVNAIITIFECWSKLGKADAEDSNANAIKSINQKKWLQMCLIYAKIDD